MLHLFRINNIAAVMLAASLLAACTTGIKELSSERVIIRSDGYVSHKNIPAVQKMANEGCGRFEKKAEYISTTHSDGGIQHDHLYLCK